VLGRIAAALLIPALALADATPPAAAPAQKKIARDRCAGERNSDGSPKRLAYAAPEQPGHTAIFDYDDFGPQGASHGLVGFAWWQWERGGSWEICDSFDVRVVVYRGRTRAQVEAAYPVVRWKSDYRYVEYRRAIGYLDRTLAEIGGDPALAQLRQDLTRTRGEIVRKLGAPWPRASE